MKIEQDEIKAAKLIIICSTLCEYAANTLIDQSRHELKLRLRGIIDNARKVQRWFMYHPNVTQQQKEDIEQEIYADDIVVLGEILNTLYGIKPEDLEQINEDLKKFINESEYENQLS